MRHALPVHVCVCASVCVVGEVSLHPRQASVARVESSHQVSKGGPLRETEVWTIWPPWPPRPCLLGQISRVDVEHVRS